MENNTCKNNANDTESSTESFGLGQTDFDVWSVGFVRSLYIYYTPLLVVLGSMGNFMSMFVFYMSKLRLQSTSHYLSALAMSDTIFLLQLLVPWLGDVQVTTLFHRRGFCQVFVYLSYVSCCLSAWLVVAFTVERFVAVVYPLRRSVVCTVARARHVIMSITIGAVLLNLPVLRFAIPLNDDCNIDREYLEHAARFNMIDTVVSFTIPLAVIIVLNTWIMVGVCRIQKTHITLVKSGRSTMQLHLRPTRAINCTSSQQRVTRMLLIVSSVFVILNLPAYTMRILAYAYDMNLNDFGGRWMALQQLSVMFFHTNFGINFILYCLSGQNFRQALILTSPCVRKKTRRAVAIRSNAAMLPARAGSVSSLYYLSNGTEGTTASAMATLPAFPRGHQADYYITRWTFDNSRQNRAQDNTNIVSVSTRNESMEMRVVNGI